MAYIARPCSLSTGTLEMRPCLCSNIFSSPPFVVVIVIIIIFLFFFGVHKNKSRKREGMRLAKLVWDLKTTKQFAGGRGGDSAQIPGSSPRGRLSTHHGAFPMRRSARSGSALQDVSEVQRRNNASLLKMPVRASVIVEQDESGDNFFDGDGSYAASLNGTGGGLSRSGSLYGDSQGGPLEDSLSSSTGSISVPKRRRSRTLKWSKSSSDVGSMHAEPVTPGAVDRLQNRTEETKHLYIQYEKRKVEAAYTRLQEKNQAEGVGGRGEDADMGADATEAADADAEADLSSVTVLGSHVRSSMVDGGLLPDDVDTLFEALLSNGDATIVTRELFYKLCTQALRGGDLASKYRGNSP